MISKALPRYSVAFPLLVISVFVFSMMVGPLYVEGDQVSYRTVYERLESLNFFDGYIFYSSYLHTFEITHFLFSWLSSKFIYKDLFIALTNSLLTYITLLLLRKWRVSIFVAVLFVLT